MKIKFICAALLSLAVFSFAYAKNYNSCMEEAQEYRSLQEYDKAIESYNEAMKYRNNDSTAFYLIGQIYEEQGKTYEADEYYMRALPTAKDPEIIYGIGAFYFKIDRLDKVEEIYVRAWRHKGNLFETNLGMGDYSFMSKDYFKAIEFYEIAIRKKEGEQDYILANLYYRYAMSLEKTGKKKEALEAARTAARYNGGDDQIREYHKKLQQEVK